MNLSSQGKQGKPSPRLSRLSSDTDPAGQVHHDSSNRGVHHAPEAKAALSHHEANRGSNGSLEGSTISPKDEGSKKASVTSISPSISMTSLTSFDKSSDGKNLFYKYGSKNDKPTRPRVASKGSFDNYSPRLSVISLPLQDEGHEENRTTRAQSQPTNQHKRSSQKSTTGGSVPNIKEHDTQTSKAGKLKDDYKGFHANKLKGIANVPPLSQPIKPRFKKKSGILLNKIMHRKEHDDTKDDLHTIDSYNSLTHSARTSRNNSIATSQRSLSVGSRQSQEQSHTEPPIHTSRSSSDLQQKNNKNRHGVSAVKHKFSIPSISLEHSKSQSGSQAPHSPVITTPIMEKPHHDAESSVSPSTTKPSHKNSFFDLDMNLDEMKGIVKSPDAISEENIDGMLAPETGPPSRLLASPSNNNMSKRLALKKSFSSAAISTQNEYASWRAPDSWDVKNENITTTRDPSLTESDDSDAAESESPVNNLIKKTSLQRKVDDEGANENIKQSADQTPLLAPLRNKSKENLPETKDTVDKKPGIVGLNLPVLYGSRLLSHVVPSHTESQGKGPNHILRVFKEDNTFTTILCPLETTTAELLSIVQRKFFLDSTSNYQLSVYIGNCTKVLEPFEKPVKIQTGLLMLSGYTDQDNLKIIGREDLSFIMKFVVENIYLRNLTHDEEATLSKDYVDVNIAGLNLKNIPIIFHQHTYEIEKLNVSDNPSIYIPLDFIQSCNNLTNINFSRNGCSKFPINFLEARKLTHLDMEKNFLDELPSKFGHLRNLTHLKLNSNQLSHLPKTFGKLKNLVSLNLSSNYFRSYPEAISELLNLRDLDLSYNDLSNVPESICKLTELSKLNLCSNKLSKSLPEYFTSLTSLKRLDIRYNMLSNVDVLGSLPNLEVAYGTKNYISTFSDSMESLRLLNFDRNPITNLHFKMLLPLLTILDLSRAKITSIPPQFLSMIPNVEKFVLDKNHLVELPKELGNLPKLAVLSLHANNLRTLPSTIGQLSSLQFLDVHSNNLQSLPDDIWNLKSLSVLNVASNILTSFPKPPPSVTKRISSKVNLKNYIMEPVLNSNKLTPADSRRPSMLSGLDSGAKEITESEGFDDSSSSSLLSYLNVSSSLADNLLVLTLSDNRISDDSFESISYLSALKTLNLSYNDILEIPEGGLRRLSRLTELYISGNELTTLPAEDLESLKYLKLLYLNNNKIVSLPPEVSKLVNLQYLDLGSNQLKYNISNWPYDWSWHWNKNLKYLNFSGNKRFEIKKSHIKHPETGEDFDSLLVLKNLKVLGLIDVTLTTPLVPDQNPDMRIRTTTSELDNVGYGVSDTMGMRECVSTRDIFIQKFRGNENEVLVASFDGKSGVPHQGHRILAFAKGVFVSMFTNELNKIKDDSEIKDAIRRTFLALNKEVNGTFAAMKSNSYSPSSKKDNIEFSLRDDGGAGCSVTIIYIKDKMLYTANIGDISALLSRSNGDHVVLATKHDPTNRTEFERIRASGGYVSGDGTLDGKLMVSRGVGFFNYLPHTNSDPDISEMVLNVADDMIVLATNVLWDYITYELAVDILREEKDDPMLAAQKLRDYAICYGATDKIAVIVISLGEQKKNRLKFGSNALYHNLRQTDFFSNKKRRDRGAITIDSHLRRLEDEIEPPVGELALVFTDIKNSTLLWDAYPTPMRSAIKTHNAIMRRQLRIVGGYEVKTEGDAFMVSFPSPALALLWCFSVQQNLLTADWPTEILESDQCCEVADGAGNIIFRGLSVRMGIHWGSPVCEPDLITGRMDYFGPMVNRTSRISAIADGGQITVSEDFLDEINALYKVNKEVNEGKLLLVEAYQGNPHAAEIINKEISSLEEIGCHYYDIGEKKLKGLETPEKITLAYPEKLKLRFEMSQKSRAQTGSDTINTRIIGALPVETIYGLRTVSLKLENICAAYGGNSLRGEAFQTLSSLALQFNSNSLFQDADIIAMLSHIVTRIESCTAALELRQHMSAVGGKDGFLDIRDAKPMSEVMAELAQLVGRYQEMLGKV